MVQNRDLPTQTKDDSTAKKIFRNNPKPSAAKNLEQRQVFKENKENPNETKTIIVSMNPSYKLFNGKEINALRVL